MVFLVENLSGNEPEGCQQWVKRCHSPRLLYRPPNLACLDCPTRSPNTPHYCLRLQPQGAGRGWQVDGADKRQLKGSQPEASDRRQAGLSSQGEGWQEAPARGVDVGVPRETRASL